MGLSARTKDYTMTLRLTQTAKTYPDGTKALLPTELSVGKGEIVSLLGPSGCGKTTLLRIIAGLETPDEGSNIWFDDDNVTALPVERRQVGMVFQSYALFPNMSVHANISYGLKMQKLPKPEVHARVTEVLDMCQLQPFASRAITALSGGQMQRVALARASLREALRDELAILLREFDITAIFVTHDQDEALAIADRVAVMSHGRVVQSGTPEDLYRNPTSSFVAGFVGNAMALRGKADGTTLHLNGGKLTLPKDGTGKTVFVRAEDVRIVEKGPLQGKVETVTFLGTHYRVVMSGIAKDTIASIHSGQSVPKVGQIIGVSIEPETLILLPEDAEVA
jgi:putative spermidine/putrescine transport system ATP-binding protein